jgi:hypothetical protein
MPDQADSPILLARKSEFYCSIAFDCYSDLPCGYFLNLKTTTSYQIVTLWLFEKLSFDQQFASARGVGESFQSTARAPLISKR